MTHRGVIDEFMYQHVIMGEAVFVCLRYEEVSQRRAAFSSDALKPQGQFTGHLPVEMSEPLCRREIAPFD